MHIYGKDQQAFHLQRTEAETWWTRVNTLVIIVQLACFLSAVIRTGTNSSNSMTNSFFINSDLTLTAPYLVDGCVYNVTRSHAFFRDVQFSISKDNVGYFVSRGVQNIRYLIAVTIVHIVVSATNRLWFETNTHEIRYHFVVFRKDTVMTWEVLLMILGLVLTLGITRENQIMTHYVAFCAVNQTVGNGFYHTVQPYTELIVSYIISIVVLFINAVYAICNLAQKNPRDALLREAKARQAEWQAMMERFYRNADAAARSKGAPGGGSGQPQVTFGDNGASLVPGDLREVADVSGNISGGGQPQSEQPMERRGPVDVFPANGGGGPHFASSQQQLRRAYADEAPRPPSSASRRRQAPILLEPLEVGYSVSQPLTPLRNEDFGDGMPNRSRREEVGGDDDAPEEHHPAPTTDFVLSGRYELHEVRDDDEQAESADAEVTHNSRPGGPPSLSDNGGAPDARQSRVASGSETSTALLAARRVVVPPPPPAYSGDRLQRPPMGREAMLAPPTPLQGGAEMTDDTVHLP